MVKVPKIGEPVGPDPLDAETKEIKRRWSLRNTVPGAPEILESMKEGQISDTDVRIAADDLYNEMQRLGWNAPPQKWANKMHFSVEFTRGVLAHLVNGARVVKVDNDGNYQALLDDSFQMRRDGVPEP